MAATFVRTVKIQTETSGLQKGAQDAATFTRSLGGVAAQANAMAASVEAATSSVVDMGQRVQTAAGAQMSMAAQMKAAQTEAQRFGATVREVSATEVRAAEALKLRWDEAYRNAQKYAQVEDSVAKSIANRTLTIDQGNTILTNASARFKQMGDDAKAANDNVRLTSGQVQGLGYQLNDVGTMLAMGASPFQIISSQAGQVIQVLGDGPGGVRGSLKAMKDSVVGFLASFGRVNLIAGGATTALLGLGAAAAYFMNKGVDAAAASEKAQKSYNLALKETKSIYGDLAGAAATAADRASMASPEIVRSQLETAVRDQQAARDAAVQAMRSAPGASTSNDYAKNLAAELGGMVSANTFDPLRKQIQDALDLALAGKSTLTEFRETLANLEIDPNADAETLKWKDALNAAAAEAAKLEAEVIGLQQAVVQVNFDTWTRALASARGEMAGFLPQAKSAADQIEEIYQRQMAAVRMLGGDDRDMQAGFRRAAEDRSKALGELSRDAVQQAKAAQDALANLSLSPDQRSIAEIRQRYDAEIADLERLNGSREAIAAKQRERDATVLAAQTEIDRANEARRANYDLDLKAIGDRTAAQRAATEGERAYIDAIAQGHTKAEAAALREEAVTLSLASAREQLAESARQRGVADQQALDQLRLEIDSIGQTAGEVARLSEEYHLLAEVKERAYQEGRSVTDDEIGAIKAQAAAIGDLNQQLAEKRLLDDIMSERSGFGMSDDEREIFDTLRGAGIDIASSNGQWLASQIRVNQEMERTRDLTKDTFKGFLDDLRSGTSLLGALGNAFANFSTKMADRGLDMLVDQMMGFGTAGGGAASGGGANMVRQTIAALTTAPRATPISASSGYGFSAPVMPVQREMLPALTRMTSSLDAAAKAIRTIESGSAGGNYSAMGPVTRSGDRAYGAYQVMGANIPQWSKAALGRIVSNVEFLGSREIQDAVFSHRFGGYMQKYGAEGASRAWFAGEGGMRNFRAQDVVGTSVAGYGSRFGNLYAQHSGGQDALARAVATGYVDGTRKIASGGVPGLDPWGGGLRDGSANISPMVQGGAGGQTSGGFFQSPLFQGGMTALGAGMAGYQSGSPLGGAFSGAMAGLATGNPIMAGIGAVSGFIGGLLGRSKQKKQEEEARKQKEAQQAQMAAQLASQIENLESYFNRSPDSNMASELRSVDQKIRELRASIKNDGIKSEDQVDGIERDALAYKELLKEEFRAVFETVTAEFGGGLGLETEFTKARDAIQALGKEARGWVEDTEEAFRVPTELRDAILADYQKAERAASTGYNAATRTADRVRRAAGDEYLDTERQDAERAVIAARKEMDAALKSAATERDKALAEYEASVAEAQRRRDAAVTAALEAGREAILRAISGNVIEQSDAEKALAQQRGAAIAASAELQRLGLSAEEAGVRIKAALAEGSARMRTDYERGVREEIEELDGRGYMGDVRALLEKRESLRKDAGLLGSDPALADELFAKRAQSIVDGADLTVEAFDKLIAAFPDLAGVVRRVTVDLEAIKSRIEGYDDRRFTALTDTSTLAGAIADFERRAARERYSEGLAGGEGMPALEAAQAAEKLALIQGLLNRARQEEVSELESTISRLKTFSDEMSDLQKSLKIDANLSPLDAQQRFLEAQKQYREIVAAAAGTGPEAEEAQAKLAGISQTYLEEARSYYASTGEYKTIFDEVQRTLGINGDTATRQLNAAEAQLKVAKDQLKATESLTDSIASLTKAFAEAQAAAKAAAIAAGVPVVGGAGTGAGTGGTGAGGGAVPTGPSFTPKNELEHFLGVQYQAILGRAPDAAGVGYYQALRDQGATADQIINMIKNSPEAKGRGYALGGFTGWGGVDDIAGFVHGQEFVLNAAAVRSLGLPTLETMNQTGSLPALPPPVVPQPARGGDGAVVVQLAEIQKELGRLGDIVFADGVETRATIERGTKVAGKTQQTLQNQAA